MSVRVLGKNEIRCKSIKIGKHDDNFDFFTNINKSKKRIRLGSKNPNRLKSIRYNVFSANSEIVMFDSKKYSKTDFFEHVKQRNIRNLLVLTRKEHDYILEHSIDFNVKVRVFEECYPFFSQIKYVSSLSDNINEAKKLLNHCESLGLKGGSASRFFTTLFGYRLERKLRYKSELDRFIYFACLPPFQEVFKAKENRNNRLIFALDFNAMFTDCLSGTFPSPKHLEYSQFDKDDFFDKQLFDGFYRVRLLNAKNTFFLTHHPFRYCKSNQSFAFNLTEGDSVEVFLPNKEIDYYSKFFESVELVEGIYSKTSIKHPLFEELTNCYAERVTCSSGSYRNKLAKLKANIISSLGNPKRFNEFSFRNKEQVVAKVEELLSIDFDSELSTLQKLDLLARNDKLRLHESDQGHYQAKIINIESHDAIYTFYSVMLSNSRIKMLKLIENLQSVDSLEFCYANVDSLHVSIDECDIDKFNEVMSAKISDEIGGIKVEAIASKGYWLELGRYWLLKAKRVIKFSNYLFNQPNSTFAVITNRRIKKVANLGGFSYVKKLNLNLYKTFSFKKMLEQSDRFDNLSYRRYDLDDVCSASVASTSVKKEKINSQSIKQALVDELTTVECSSNITHKP